MWYTNIQRSLLLFFLQYQRKMMIVWQWDLQMMMFG